MPTHSSKNLFTHQNHKIPTFISYKPELSLPILVEESLDSIGQPTGEQPAADKTARESATENSCQKGIKARGKGEKVG